MEHLYEYLIFLAEAVTVVIAVLVIAGAIASLAARRQSQVEGHLEVRKVNDRLLHLRDSVLHAMLDHGSFRKLRRQEMKASKAEIKKASKQIVKGEKAKTATPVKPRVFVLDFDGDLHATGVDNLRTEITAVLSLAQPSDSVLVRLESPGGAVHAYGLAASQLDRIRQHGIPLVVAVDKVAASGGYLMAAVADRVLAAPFAVLGSIGVLAQVPNVHRLLKKHDIDVEVLTAGKYKRTLTMLGENTAEGRAKFIEELEDVHKLFQEFVGARRPQLDLDQVATGEAWHGQRALDLKLVDEINTSDEYLTQACETSDVYEVHWIEHKKPFERLMSQVEGSMSRAIDKFTNMGSRA